MKKISILSISFLLAFGLGAGLASANASEAKEAKALDATNFEWFDKSITTNHNTSGRLFDGDLNTGVTFSKDVSSQKYCQFRKKSKERFNISSIDIYFPKTSNVWENGSVAAKYKVDDATFNNYLSNWTVKSEVTEDYKIVTINVQGFGVFADSFTLYFDGDAGASGEILEIVVHEEARATLPTYHVNAQQFSNSSEYKLANFYDGDDETEAQFCTYASSSEDETNFIVDLPEATTIRDVKLGWATGYSRRCPGSPGVVVYYSTDNGANYTSIEESTEYFRGYEDDSSTTNHNRLIYQLQTPLTGVTNLKLWYKNIESGGWYKFSEFAYNVTSEDDPIVSATLSRAETQMKNNAGQLYSIIDDDDTTQCWFNGRLGQYDYISLKYPNTVNANGCYIRTGNISDGDHFAGDVKGYITSLGDWRNLATFKSTSNLLKLRFTQVWDVEEIRIFAEWGPTNWTAVRHFKLFNESIPCTVTLGGGYSTDSDALIDPVDNSGGYDPVHLADLVDNDSSSVVFLGNPNKDGYGQSGRLFFQFSSAQTFTSLAIESVQPESPYYSSGDYVAAITLLYWNGAQYVSYGTFAANNSTHILTASLMNNPTIITTGLCMIFEWSSHWIRIQDIKFNVPLESYFVGNWDIPYLNVNQNLSHMTDGNYSTGVWFDSGIAQNAYIVIDLGESKRINDVVLFQQGNVADGNGDAATSRFSTDYLKHCKLQYSPDASVWNDFADGAEFVEEINIFYKPDELVNARYIRVVNLIDNTSIGAVIREFRVNTTDDLIDAIMNSVTCDDTGKTAPSGWSSIEAPYTALDEGIQNALKNAVTVKNGANLLDNALEKYDYVMSKYGSGTYSNYLDRAISPLHSGYFFNTIFGSKESNSVILVIVISAVALSGIAVFFLLRRKREN